MSLDPISKPITGDIYLAGWLTMVVGGGLGTMAGLHAFYQDERWALAPLLFFEGTGLTLIGISEIVRNASNSKAKDKLRAAGLTSLGLGIGTLGIPLVVDNDRKLYVIISSAILAFGTILTAVGEDRANVIWRA